MERAKLHELVKLRQNCLRDKDRILEHLGTVKDTMPDRIDLLQGPDDAVHRIGYRSDNGLQRLRVVRRLDLLRHLLAARLLIDEAAARNADALHKTLAEHLLALHVEEHVLERG